MSTALPITTFIVISRDSVLSLTTDAFGDSEDWRDVDGLLENIMLQENGNCGKSGYTHTCNVEF